MAGFIDNRKIQSVNWTQVLKECCSSLKLSFQLRLSFFKKIVQKTTANNEQS